MVGELWADGDEFECEFSTWLLILADGDGDD